MQESDADRSFAQSTSLQTKQQRLRHDPNESMIAQREREIEDIAQGIIELANGASVPEHVHDKETELLYVLSGSGTMTVGGVKLVRTYTFKRGDYVVDVKNEIVNESGAPVSPRLYLQLVRDGVPPPGESAFYFTFTGPSIDDGATVGPASLVMRGERVPAGSVWSGNPITPWTRPPWQR